MAPSTRTSGRWNQDGADSNLELILENFETFKRKHITQNREIIKTNALAQLRIRELEARIQALEGEKAEKAIEAVRWRASMQRAEHASEMLRRAWKTMEKGFLAMAHCEEADSFESIIRSAKDDRLAEEMMMGKGMGTGMNGMPLPPHLRRGNRISIDPALLAGGVVRSVARPPPVAIDNVVEEGEEDNEEDQEEEDGQDMDKVTRHRWWNGSSSSSSSQTSRVPAKRIQIQILPHQLQHQHSQEQPYSRSETPFADLASDSEAEGFSGSESGPSSTATHPNTASSGGVTRRRRSSKTFTSKAKASTSGGAAGGSQRTDTPSWKNRDMVLPDPVTLDAEGAPSPLPSPNLEIDLGGTTTDGLGSTMTEGVVVDKTAGLRLLHAEEMQNDYYDFLPSSHHHPPTPSGHGRLGVSSARNSSSSSSSSKSSKRQSQEKALRSRSRRSSARRNSQGSLEEGSERSETEGEEEGEISPRLGDEAGEQVGVVVSLVQEFEELQHLQDLEQQQQQQQEEREQHSLRHTASIDSLSSYGDTEIEVSDDESEDEEDEDEESPETPGLDQENEDETIKVNSDAVVVGASVGQAANTTPAPPAHLQLPPVETAKARTPEGRKRKIPTSPDDLAQSSGGRNGSNRSNVRRSSLRRSTLDNSNSTAGIEADEDDANGAGSGSRRVSGRVRKSINYALPKLNTKMRRPDPGELVPAGETALGVGAGVGLMAMTTTTTSSATPSTNRRRSATSSSSNEDSRTKATTAARTTNEGSPTMRSSNRASPPASSRVTPTTSKGRSRSATPDAGTHGLDAPSTTTATTTTMAGGTPASQRKATPAISQSEWRRIPSPSTSAEATPVVGGGKDLHPSQDAHVIDAAPLTSSSERGEEKEDDTPQTDESTADSAIGGHGVEEDEEDEEDEDDDDEEYTPAAKQKGSRVTPSTSSSSSSGGKTKAGGRMVASTSGASSTSKDTSPKARALSNANADAKTMTLASSARGPNSMSTSSSASAGAGASTATPKASTSAPVRMTLADFGLERGTLSPIPSSSVSTSNASNALPGSSSSTSLASATPKSRGASSASGSGTGSGSGAGSNGASSVKALSVAHRNRAASGGSIGPTSTSTSTTMGSGPRMAKSRGLSTPTSLPHSVSNPTLSSSANGKASNMTGEGQTQMKERPRTFSGATGRHLINSASVSSGSSSLGRSHGELSGTGTKQRGSLHAALTASVASSVVVGGGGEGLDPRNVALPPTPLHPSTSSNSSWNRNNPLGPAGVGGNVATPGSAPASGGIAASMKPKPIL